MSDQEWLRNLIRIEISGMEEDAQREAFEIGEAIKIFDESLSSCTLASSKGVSKEKWLNYPPKSRARIFP